MVAAEKFEPLLPAASPREAVQLFATSCSFRSESTQTNLARSNCEEHRLFSDHARQSWTQKFNHFSDRHMRSRGFRSHVKSIHDPLRKRPDWIKIVLASLGDRCRRKGIEPARLFHSNDSSREGRLAVVEFRRSILTVKTDLSDREIVHMFDLLADGRGFVPIAGLAAQVGEAMATVGSSDAADTCNENLLRRAEALYFRNDRAADAVAEAERMERPLYLPTRQELDGRLVSILSSAPRKPNGRRKRPDKHKFCSSGDEGKPFQRLQIEGKSEGGGAVIGLPRLGLEDLGEPIMLLCWLEVGQLSEKESIGSA
eukprot:TRINITY_DN5306_c0_g1_i2.p1 TRINITY_DN5306_c0_g1~~TRINITY_DN5306_c0_g1_i2.p1  ORF type:complete len:313 (+),score=52.15 TRINITY_DN5306_c0_g1_i2:59-997(+)